ncbi:MAG TPA: DegT/DnrJ/EryC1/StrS aminotransferase family protein [Propionicimonas sp.]|nr:DegT/DnrJ/EryC1/StrS aminotransferase family protein [Propionicimonas sp.]
MIRFTGAGHPPIPIAFADWYVAPRARAAASQALASGWVTNGPEVAAFETEFAAYVGARWAVAVSSCISALELSLRALALPTGSGVLVSTIASCGVFQAIVRSGLRPVLMDVSALTGLPTDTSVAEAVGRDVPGADRPRAMVIVHWAGDAADVVSLAEAAGIPAHLVLEDAAQALGARLGERHVGGRGTACFSFYSTQNLPIGEGGMVTTDDRDRADWIREARLGATHAPRARPDVPRQRAPHGVLEGGNRVDLSDLSAAIGRGQLAYVTPWQRRRAELAAQYDAALLDIPGVTLPHRPEPGTGEHAWNHYWVRVEHPDVTRDSLVNALHAAGIRTGTRYVPLHRLSYCRELSNVPGTGLPGADLLVDQLVLLPIYPRLPGGAADRVAAVLRSALGRRGVS